MNEKEMMERYIYEVIKRVPQSSREEIRLELQTLIEDMCTEENITIEEALQRLGNPAEFAKSFRDENCYLIGPEYYDNYIWVIKLALIGIGISAFVSALINGILTLQSQTAWGNFFTTFFSELSTTAVNGTLSAVGLVTIIFAFMEHQKLKIDLKPEDSWSVDKLSQNAVSKKIWTPLTLPPVPDKRALISRGDSIFSIIFITVFTALFLFAPQIFSAFHQEGDQLIVVSNIFNLEKWDILAPVLVLSMAIGLVDAIIQLVTGYYCKAVMISSIVCNGLQIVCAFFLLKVLPLWNPNFLDEIRAVLGYNEFTSHDILRYWGTDGFGTLALLIISVIAIIEVGYTIYKTLRYGK